jgi:hypothetical protein
MRVSVGLDGVGDGAGVAEAIGVADGSVLGIGGVVAFLQPAPKSERAIAAASVKGFKDEFFIWSDGGIVL